MRKGSRFYYGWVIVAISFLTIFLAMGLRYSFGVFFTAIINEYGWGRGETAGAFSLAMLVHALFLPATGVLIDRIGPRRLFPLGAVLLSLGLAAASQIKVMWHLYLFFGVFISIGVNTLSYSPHMSVIPRWFIQKRGLATGLVISGIGLGTMVLAPLNGAIIDHIGWRPCFLLLAAPVFVTLVPGTAIFQRRTPSEVGQYPDGFRPERTGSFPLGPRNSGESTRLLSAKIWTLSSALQTKGFWCTFLSVFCNGFAINFFVVHQVAIIVDMGYSNLAQLPQLRGR